MNGLIFPSGSTVSVEIIESLKNQKTINNLIGVNSTINYETSILFQKTYNDCPTMKTGNKCIEYLLNICKKEMINFIIPTVDEAHFFLSKNIQDFKKLEIKIITSDAFTNEICISKEYTYNYFKHKIKCPRIYTFEEATQFPLFVKPKVGYGSRNCYKVDTIAELENCYSNDKLILEYLPHEEYTVDCFTYKTKLLYTLTRIRKLAKNGLSVITAVETDQEKLETILTFAKTINRFLNFKGAWFFQCKYDHEYKLTLLEVSTRIAGASSINRVKGCNLVLLSIYAHYEYPISIRENNLYQLSVTKIYKNYLNLDLTKYKKVYIDLDDTLIITEKVNEECIYFIYKMKNMDKEIILLTRHLKNVEETLLKVGISKTLFNQVIIPEKDETKSKYIEEWSIFVDDSFRERKDCEENVLCLDVDSLSFLLK